MTRCTWSAFTAPVAPKLKDLRELLPWGEAEALANYHYLAEESVKYLYPFSERLERIIRVTLRHRTVYLRHVRGGYLTLHGYNARGQWHYRVDEGKPGTRRQMVEAVTARLGRYAPIIMTYLDPDYDHEVEA